MNMHRFVIGVCITLTIAFPLFSMGAQKEQPLTVYAYDSFSGDWGPGKEVVAAFEEKHDIPVKIISAGDGMEMLTKVIAEKDHPFADVVIGISDEVATRAYRADLLSPITLRCSVRFPYSCTSILNIASCPLITATLPLSLIPR